MDSCICGGSIFVSDVKSTVKIVTDPSGKLRISEPYRKRFFYIRCDNCDAIYEHHNGNISVPKDTVAKICNDCNSSGVCCTECVLMSSKLLYKISRNEDVSMRQLHAAW